jgi:uncharacterized protein YfkK (UPF0435 family)
MDKLNLNLLIINPLKSKKSSAKLAMVNDGLFKNQKENKHNLPVL